MTLIQIGILLAVATLTAVTSVQVAPDIGDREAVKQLARWSREPVDENQLERHPPLGAAEYRVCAMTRATSIAWVVWATSVLLGLGVGLLMGRGGLFIGEPTVERGEVGLAFFLVKLLLIIFVLGIARLLVRVAGRVVAASYAAAVVGIIVGALLAIPATLLLKLFIPDGPLEAIEVPIALHVSLFCGTVTIAAVAAVLAPMIIPATRDAEAGVTRAM
jgi:hypothetical protein